MLRRVVILGSESTGKTTLAQDLARHFGTVWVPEYAREYLANRTCTHADIDVIGRGQDASEQRLARKANRVLICDTDLLTTWFWSHLYFGRCPAWIEAASRRQADLYLLTAPDVPWVADGLRDRPHMRQEIDAAFRAALAERGFPYTVISGTWAERFATAVAAIEEVMGMAQQAATVTLYRPVGQKELELIREYRKR
jgi:HTH-type transcriptional regulator, transcriptional repressor of NAD biosynthesis genes